MSNFLGFIFLISVIMIMFCLVCKTFVYTMEMESGEINPEEREGF